MKLLKNLLYTTAFLLGGVGAYQVQAQETPLLTEKDANEVSDLGIYTDEAMMVADIDNDGDEDFIVAAHARGPAEVHLYRYWNDGKGNFRKDQEPFARLESAYDVSPAMIPIRLYKDDPTVSLIVSVPNRVRPKANRFIFRNDGHGNYKLLK